MNKNCLLLTNCLMRLSKYHLAILAIILTNIIWGASAPIFKWALEDVHPFTFAFLRFFIAALILLPFTLHKLVLNRDQFVKLLTLSFIGFFIHISLFLFGLTLASSINAPIIASSAPALLIIGSVIFLKEKIKRYVVFGTTVSFIGILIIILRPLLDQGVDTQIIGNLLFLFSTISLVGYTLLLKRFRLRLSTITITFWLFAISALFFFPFFLWESAQFSSITNLSTKATLGIVFAGVFTSVVAYVCYNYALKYIHANETGVYMYIDPIATVAIAIPLLGEKITETFIIGSFFVFIGIFIAQRRIQYHPLQKFIKKQSETFFPRST